MLVLDFKVEVEYTRRGIEANLNLYPSTPDIDKLLSPFMSKDNDVQFISNRPDELLSLIDEWVAKVKPVLEKAGYDYSIEYLKL